MADKADKADMADMADMADTRFSEPAWSAVGCEDDLVQRPYISELIECHSV